MIRHAAGLHPKHHHHELRSDEEQELRQQITTEEDSEAEQRADTGTAVGASPVRDTQNAFSKFSFEDFSRWIYVELQSRYMLGEGLPQKQ